MSSLNLSKISQVVENYMEDELTVLRPGVATIDEISLMMDKPYTEIYSGKGFLVPEGTPYPAYLGGQQTSDTRFEIAIPAASEVVMPNDEVRVETSKWNPDMEGMMFIVVGEVESTFFTHRRLTCYKKQDAS